MVRAVMREIRERFKDFQNAHEICHERFSSETDKEASSKYYMDVVDQIATLEGEVATLLARVEQEISHSQVQGVTSAVRPEDSVTHAGSRRSFNSRRSTCSRASSRAEVAAKQAGLEAKAATLKKLHELEAQELQIRQKRMELEIQSEITAFEAERKVYESIESEKALELNLREENVVPTQSQVKFSTPREAAIAANPSSEQVGPQQVPQVSSFEVPISVQGHDPPSPHSLKLNPKVTEWRLARSDPSPNQQSSFNEEVVAKLLDAQNKQNHTLQQLVEQQQQGVVALTLPQPCLQIFDGNPANYCDFIRAFEHLIEGKTSSPNSRLYYLIQSCSSMGGNRGYSEARRLLKERYGQNYRIPAAHVQQLIDGPVIKSEHGAALQQFSTRLTSCTNTFKELGYLSKLDNPDSLKKIIGKLPYSMRLKWHDVVDNITQVQDREATIEDITKFVNAKARAVSHPIFGKISEPEKNAQIKGPGKRSNGFGGFRAASYGTQVDRASRDANGANTTEPKCPLCKSNHWLARCREFRGKSLEDRLRIVKDKSLCNNCLTIGHFARRCPKDSFCKVEGCTAKHSTFLHPKPTTNSQSQSAGTIADSSDMALSQPDLPHSETAVSSFVNMSSKSTISSAIGLAILPVKVKSPGNPAVVERSTFLDNGSNASFCTKQLLNRLGLEGRQSKISLTTLRGTNESVRCSLVDLQVFDLNEENMIEISSVYSMPSLPVNKEDIATREDIDRWPHLNGVEVPAIDAEIGLLIGSNVPQVLQPREIRVGEHGGPYATKTLLGWTVNGLLGRLSDREGLYANFVKADAALSQQFERFCNLEFNDSADNDLAMSRNDLRALSVMEETAQL